jgi:hypothetical protein
VGIIAFQMLTGRLPFIGENTQVLLAQLDEKPPAPSSLAPEVPPALESIVLRLLAKQALKRFQSAEAVRKELAALSTKRTPVPETPTSSGVTVSLGPRTIEVPMVDSSSDETEPAPIEPVTDMTLSRPTKPRWVIGAAVATVALATTAVAVTALHKRPPAPTMVAEARAPSIPAPALAPAPLAPSPVPPPTVASAAPSAALATTVPVQPQKPLVVEGPKPRKIVKAVAHKPVAVSAVSRSDPKSLLARTAEAESRMLKVNPLICTNSSPAFAALKDLEKQIQESSTEEQRAKLAGLLDVWEQMFLQKP